MKTEIIWNPLRSSLKKIVGRDVSIEFSNGETTCGELIQRDDFFECGKILFRNYDVKTIKIFPVTKVRRSEMKELHCEKCKNSTVANEGRICIDNLEHICNGKYFEGRETK